MKKKLIYLGAFLITAGLFNSCDMLGETCQYCEVLVNGDPIEQYSGDYCGEELVELKLLNGTTIGDGVATVECE